MGIELRKLLGAKLIWDGGDEVRIPEQMGIPRDDQMQGTAAERLTELAGRACYDSLGKGRPSFSTSCSWCQGNGVIHHKDKPATACTHGCNGGRIEGYHDHILAVGHGSVLEHFNFTVELVAKNPGEQSEIMAFRFIAACANRPGVLVIPCGEDGVRITLNLRAVLEWDQFVKRFYGWLSRDGEARYLGDVLRFHGLSVTTEMFSKEFSKNRRTNDPSTWQASPEVQFVNSISEPINDRERWVSLFMWGSRGFSHEQVRHGDFTAISQRSTRYVDESEGEWVQHPLMSMYLAEHGPCELASSDRDLPDGCRAVYDEVVEALEPWLISRGVDKLSARKQARGAARGYLGNALQTEMVFSASVAQWRWMLQQRASVFADAEIRLIYNDVLRELKASRYADRFADMSLVDSPDGIGQVLSIEESKQGSL